MATRLFDLNGVGKAMAAMQSLIGSDVWSGRGHLQEELLSVLPDVFAGLPRIPEMSGFAALTAEPLNEALCEAGFDIQLAPWHDDGRTVGAISMLKVGVKWLVEGFRLDSGNRPYLVQGTPAFLLKTLQHGVSFLEVDGSREPGVCVQTQSGDSVYFLRTDKEPHDWVEMYERAMNLCRAADVKYPDYAGVIVPMLKADHQPNIEWLLGLNCGGYGIDQALQQVRFMMNHVGARVESATAVAATRGMGPRYPTLDGPFLCAITRPEMVVPIFAGYLDTDVFADPGNLAL